MNPLRNCVNGCPENAMATPGFDQKINNVNIPAPSFIASGIALIP